MLRIVDFALNLSSETTEGSSPHIRVTTARDICLEAFNELQNRVDHFKTRQLVRQPALSPAKGTVPKSLGFSTCMNIYSRKSLNSHADLYTTLLVYFESTLFGIEIYVKTHAG